MIASKRRDEIKEAIINLLEECEIRKLPIDLQKILRVKGWFACSFREASQIGLKPASQDGFTISRCREQGREYIIFYNHLMPRSRLRWTIAHEIGHIVLEHATMKPNLEVFENEAHYFAKALLAPVAVLGKLKTDTAESIAQICDISASAAEIRLRDYHRHCEFHQKYGYTALDKKFLKQFLLSK